MKPTIIATVGLENVLAVNSRRIPQSTEERNEFFSRVRNNRLIIDRDTYESTFEIPGNSELIIYDKDLQYTAKCEVTNSLFRAIVQTPQNSTPFIMGTAKFYEEIVRYNLIQRVILINTGHKVDTQAQNVESIEYFPELNMNDWEEVRVLPKISIVTRIYEKK